MFPAVFLDRDGTVIYDYGYISSTRNVELLPNAVNGLKLLQNVGYKLIIISNQSGVGRGLFPLKVMQEVMIFFEQLLRSEGIDLAGIYVCPHAPNERCSCRKPGPGMLLQAATDLRIDLKRSYMIGDKHCDVEAGKKAGCKSIFISSEHRLEAPSFPDLYAAANWIIEQTL